MSLQGFSDWAHKFDILEKKVIYGFVPYKVSDEQEIWDFLGRYALPRSNCLKANTAAALVKNGEIISFGWNSCAPDFSILKEEDIQFPETPERDLIKDFIKTKKKYLYEETILVCPRKFVKTGKHYEWCGPVHAEVRSVLNLRSIPPEQEEFKIFASHNLTGFSSEEIYEMIVKFMDYEYYPKRLRYNGLSFNREDYKLDLLADSELFLIGHYWVCNNCKKALESVGVIVNEDHLNKEYAQRLKRQYDRNNLTGTEDTKIILK